MAEAYNPLAKRNLGESVAKALLKSPVRPLSDTTNVVGAGVYAIYYTGPFPAYQSIAKDNSGKAYKQPIYVGKAIPSGGRKGGLGADASIGNAMQNRLNDHAATIREATNLELTDFSYRCLAIDDIWIPLGENMMIEAFKPIWNKVIDGFGNKTPGARRATQKRSPWDVLHPGRAYVGRLGLAESHLTAEMILRKLDDFYRGIIPAKPIGGSEPDEA